MNKGTFFRAFSVIALFSSGCTIPETPTPLPTGPSERALSLTLAASPDILQQNGGSQSTISILALDANGQPRSNLTLRLDTVTRVDPVTGLITFDTLVDNLGTLSANTITTDGAGRATVFLTAPSDTCSGGNVTIRALPVGNDFANTVPRYVTIRLVPPTVTPTPGAPVANFAFSPPTAPVNTTVVFDASSSRASDGFVVSYTWDWGDGVAVTRTNAIEQHDWTVPNTYSVKLTVTDDMGNQGSVCKPIVITP